MKLMLVAISMLLMTVNTAAHDLDKDYFLFVKEFLTTIQQRTFDNNREYCGYFGYNANDELIATKPTKGEEDSCYSEDPPISLDLVASYHTHGAFSVDADSELPSSNDMQADLEEGVDGFIATPGGRIWYIDSEAGVATMECGRNCILADPRFNGSLLDPVKKSYTIKTLQRREDGYLD
ncbi:MAG: DUF4329 domain-containing protein [Rhizobiales bacterium]|nr:DUF4329 domain-containing protein [Hyphomicrobiales bacterium]NRB12796.1 DUF4329 domain-containing protein [Hyphomicrobiales bacterium]